MGIVNLTDDSYYAASRCFSPAAAMTRIRTLVDEGAEIIDLGACSTRPGSEPVGAQEEWRRLKPVLEAVAVEMPDLHMSIDTYHSSVISMAYELLASHLGAETVRNQLIVNDISAGEDDPQMLPLVGSLGLAYIAMHKRGDSVTMQNLTEYDDVVQDVKSYFDAFAEKAQSAGLRDWILDPGFGFAKTVEQNYQLLNDLDVMADKVSGAPRILVGVSRKSMIYKPLDLQPDDVLPATQAVHMAALMKGADILRVHDVKEARQTVRLYQFL